MLYRLETLVWRRTASPDLTTLARARASAVRTGLRQLSSSCRPDILRMTSIKRAESSSPIPWAIAMLK